MCNIYEFAKQFTNIVIRVATFFDVLQLTAYRYNQLSVLK